MSDRAKPPFAPNDQLVYAVAGMPRLAANIGFLWPDRPMAERFGAAADAGFKAVEAHWPFEVPPDRVRDFCAERGVAMLAVNTPLGNADAGEKGLGAVAGREDEFQAGFDTALDWVAAAGGTAVHAMAGVAAWDAAGKATLIDNLKRAADKAAARGLVVLLEPINRRDFAGYFYSRCGEVAEIVDAVGRDNVRMMFDMYHVGVTEGDVSMRLRTYLPIVGHVQIAAVPSRQEPDTGELDFRFLLNELDASGYDGWVGCEYKPRAGTDDGLSWVADLGFSLG